MVKTAVRGSDPLQLRTTHQDRRSITRPGGQQIDRHPLPVADINNPESPKELLTFVAEPAFVVMAAPDQNDSDTDVVVLLTEHQMALRWYVRSLLPGDPLAKDVAQQANAKIWEKRAEFEQGTNFKAWAFSIARYEVLNYRKRQARDRRLFFSSDLELVIASELSDKDFDFQGRLEALQGCLDKLRAQDRQLLFHRYSSGGTLNEFAENAGRSVGALKVTLHRLRSALLDCLQRSLRTGEASP